MTFEYNHKKTMASLKDAVDSLAPQAASGDADAQFGWAFGKALYEVVEETGCHLTDFPFFKGTSYYTGDRFSKGCRVS